MCTDKYIKIKPLFLIILFWCAGIVVNTDDTDSEDDAEDEPAADGPPQLDASGQPVKTSKKTRKRQRLRPNLSKKPSDFQVNKRNCEIVPAYDFCFVLRFWGIH